MRIRIVFSILFILSASTTMVRKSDPDRQLSLLPVYVIWASSTCCVPCWCWCHLLCPADRTGKPLVLPRWGVLFHMPGVDQEPQYSQNSQSLPLAQTLRAASLMCMHKPSKCQTKVFVWNPPSGPFWIAPQWAVFVCVLLQYGSFGLHAQPVKTEMVKEKQIMSE